MGTAQQTELTTTVMTNTSRGFYPALGPFLARRDVLAEVGGHMWDDDGKQWWVVRDGTRVAGFAAATQDAAGAVTLKSTWVHPDYRRRGIHTGLVRARLEAFPGRSFRAVCTSGGLPQLLAAGFTVVREKGQFTEVRRGA